MFKLSSLEVESFRGFSARTDFDLNARTILILGPNGTGKSSFLDAIEFALFGDVAHFFGSEFTRTRDELVNTFGESKDARVALTLSDNNGNHLQIIRIKTIGRKETSVTVNYGEQVLEGDEADRRIKELLKLDLARFYNSVYLHQALIHDMVAGSPQDKAEALDHLLGLEEIREIIEAVPLAAADKKAGLLLQDLEKIQARHEALAPLALRDMESAKSEILHSLSTNELNPSVFRDQFADAANEFRRLAIEHELKFEVPVLELDHAEMSVNQLHRLYKKILESTPPRVRVLRAEVDSLAPRIDGISELERDLRQAESGVEEALGRWKSVQVLSKELVASRKGLSQLNKRKDLLDQKYSLLEMGIAALKKTEKAECPLCHLRWDRAKLSRHLRSEIRQTKRVELNWLQKRIGNASKKVDSLSEDDRRYKEATAGFQEAIDRAKDFSDNAMQEGILDASFDEKEPLDSLRQIKEILKSRRKEVQRELDQETASEADRVNEASGTLERLDLIASFFRDSRSSQQAKEELGRLESELEVFKAASSEANSLAQRYRSLTNTLAATKAEIANRLLQQFEPTISAVYSRLNPHPYYKRLIVQVESNTSNNEFSYRLRALDQSTGQMTSVRSRFSMGQMNLVAISIFLSLTLGSGHNLDTIMLDEPEQCLDLKHIGNLVDVLRDLQAHKQIIVATQSQEFKNLLTGLFAPPVGETRILYEFEGWSKDGPKLRKYLPQEFKLTNA